MSLEEVRGRFRRIGRIPDPLSYVFSGLAVASLGIILLAWSLGLVSAEMIIPLVLVSLGLVLLLDAATRYRRPWTRWKAKPYAVLGSCLALSGAAMLAGLEAWWSVVIVVAGAALILEGLFRLRRTTSTSSTIKPYRSSR